MGPKLLFVLGIILVHGALAAAWVGRETLPAREAVASCVNSPVPMPDFQPQRELLAHVVDVREDFAQP